MHDVQRPGTIVTGHHQPATLDEALDITARLGSRGRVLAGGTDLLLELARDDRHGVEELIDLSRVGELRAISLDGDELRLGALVTHNDVISHAAVVEQALPLAQASLEVGSPALRNRATVVGNVVTASPANDTISALIALDATMEIASRDHRREEPILDFITGFRSTTLHPEELVTGVRIRGLNRSHRGLFAKSGLRRAQAISVVHIAIVIEMENGGVQSARVALGSVAPQVVRAGAAEEALRGTQLDDASITRAAREARTSASPIDDVRSTADHRAALVELMVTQMLTSLRDGREREMWPPRAPTLGGNGSGRPGSQPPVSHRDDDVVATVVNGEEISAGGAVGRTLLDWLRDDAHYRSASSLTGTKEGCAEGECGACTVVLNGDAVLSCLVPAVAAHGSEITTVEGLASSEAHAAVQNAFIEHGAVQCGFCTPGFVVAASRLIDELADPSHEEIAAALAGNLCRCTGYTAIFAAIDSLADASP